MRVLVVSRHSTLTERALLGRTLRRNSSSQGKLLIYEKRVGICPGCNGLGMKIAYLFLKNHSSVLIEGITC
jgi:hypothetical protein